MAAGPRSGITLTNWGLAPSRAVRGGSRPPATAMALPTRRIKVIEAGHPVSRRGGSEGRRAKPANWRRTPAPTISCWCCLSGGGSANWIAPVDGVSFAQKQQGHPGAAALGRADRRGDQHRAQALVADQGRPARAPRPVKRADIVTLAISDVSARRSFRDRVGVRRCRIRRRWRMARGIVAKIWP